MSEQFRFVVVVEVKTALVFEGSPETFDRTTKRALYAIAEQEVMDRLPAGMARASTVETDWGVGSPTGGRHPGEPLRVEVFTTLDVDRLAANDPDWGVE